MYRHPQMVSRTKIFAGQDSNSSATYLRWLGPVWEQAHKGDVPEQYLPWKREYLPVGLANGAAGSHIGLDSFWKYAGGSQDVAGNVIDPLDVFKNSPYDSGEFDQLTGTGVSNIINYDYPADFPYAGQAYANTSYNDQIGGNRFGWPYGEYQPVFGDAGGGKSFWRSFPAAWAPSIDMWHPMESELDSSNSYAYTRDQYSNPPVGYINGKWAKEYSNASYSGDTTIDGINPFFIYNVQIIDSYSAPNPPYDSATFKFRMKPNSLDNPYYTSGYGDFNDNDTAQMLYWLGYDPDDLNDIMDTMTLHVTNNNTNGIFEYTVPVSKLIQESSGYWGFFGGDFTPNLPNGDYPYENGEWDGGLIGFQPKWGTDPFIEWRFKRHKAWDVRPRNWGMTMGSEFGYEEAALGYQTYYPHGHVERQPEIRTSTRSVLLYDLTPTLPSGAPIMKAELFLTSKARTNWPDNTTPNPSDWPTAEDDLTENETGPRRYKVGAGPQYQLSLLHPLTTKQCTWGTYDGTNAWTDLIANTAGNQTIGGTCSILPNVFNLGSGLSGEGGQDAEKWRGLGWRNSSVPADQNGDGFHDTDESVSIHDNRVAYQRFEWDTNSMNIPEPSKYQINAVTAGSPVEVAGITGGGVMVVPSRKEEVGTRNDNGHAHHPDDNFRRGFMTPGNESKFTQAEIVAATGRRYDDVKDFNFSTGTGAGGSKVVLDVTDFAKYAVNNLGGKMRLAITGKTLNGAAKNEDPHDKWKSESTWSHYAYQYYPRFKIDHDGIRTSIETNYGGGVGDTDGTALAQFPQCGPHTVRTEFYSLNDEELQLPLDRLSFRHTEQEQTNPTDLHVDFDDIVSSLSEFKVSIGEAGGNPDWLILTDDFSQTTTETPDVNKLKIQIIAAPTNFPAGVLSEWELLKDKINAFVDQFNNILAGQNGLEIKMRAGEQEDSSGNVRITMGGDATDTPAGFEHTFFIKDETIAMITETPQWYMATFTISCFGPDGGEFANTDSLLRFADTGADYTPNGIDCFNGYIFGMWYGNGTTVLPTFPDTPPLTGGNSMRISPSTYIAPSLKGNFIGFDSIAPITFLNGNNAGVGSIIEITHSVPDGITHDNRGVYQILNIPNPSTIEVEQIVTNQGWISSTDGYGSIPLTILDRRPYLKITYSEQEDYGV